MQAQVAGLGKEFVDVDVDVRVEVARGEPAQHLARESARAALVVVGTRHRPGHRHFALDAERRAVLEHATGPVAVVPAFG